ncbi:rRNA maturation RNase YbeY [Spiroplasma endosymbiont of Crioceris asparagi]|uniref:rRNA maturation RNase YbeY n=1 Tax=Spiroplasma endosymbiont of Crioceris asparagi TaxID=3066286 RepID=UPI0030D46306
MNEINFFDKYNKNNLIDNYKNIFEELLFAAKKILDIKENLELSVIFISDEESLEIEKVYRGVEKIGDVISFPAEDNLIESNVKELGDIFIAFDEANRKAIKFNHDIKTEMAWCFVHGLLHIMGYDHELGEKEEDEMFKLTDDILHELNIKYNIEKVIGE